MKSRNVGSSIIDTKLEPPGGGGGQEARELQARGKRPLSAVFRDITTA